MDLLLPKMERFCGYQPRSIHEVRIKFKGEADNPAHLEDCLEQLKALGYLDDRKFALDYTRGKIRAHSWGPRMVAYRLAEKHIARPWIEEAIQAHQEEFKVALEQILHKKLRPFRQVASPVPMAGLRRYLGQKGFDWEDIDRALKHL